MRHKTEEGKRNEEATRTAAVSRDMRTTCARRATTKSSAKTTLLLLFWAQGLGEADARTGEW